ncbi:MAG: hypothetical protein JO182_21645, partial [Acidobacteriaceae bacterium]|nr:hypothetical protein [Acidobacteriaceae bacterium]
VSEQGDHIRYDALRETFLKLARRAGIRKSETGRGPSLHALRHTFAIERMRVWQSNGESIKDLLPHLSVYLGHVQPAHTYWYLTATPELLTMAGDAFHAYAHEGGNE